MEFRFESLNFSSDLLLSNSNFYEVELNFNEKNLNSNPTKSYFTNNYFLISSSNALHHRTVTSKCN